MKLFVMALSLLASSASSAAFAEPEIACYTTLQNKPNFGFTIEAARGDQFEGVLFPTVDPEDQGRFLCHRQERFIVCQGQPGVEGWHVKIEPTPHGDFASLYGEAFEGNSTRLMSFDCRPR